MSFSFLASTNLAIVYLRRSGVVNASAFRLIEIETKFDLIHELEWTGNTVTGICKKYGVSRKNYYKWKNGYFNDDMGGPRELSTTYNKLQGRHSDRRNNLRFTVEEIRL
jgi:transposase-like protein